MRARWAAIVGLLIGVGCSDTGVLAEVTFEGDSLVVDELKFFIGAQTAEDGLFEPAEQTPIVVDLKQRDLANGSFTVLFRAGDFGDAAAAMTPLRVVAIAMANGQQVAYGRVPDAVRFVDGEIRRYRIELSRDESAWVTDDGCVYAGGAHLINWEVDKDCDGDLAEVDCDDNDSGIGPSAVEKCDGLDNNCNGACDEGVDRDGDGFDGCNKPLNATCSNAGDPRTEWDCDDNDPKINPGATEECDGIDNNCDRQCDDLITDDTTFPEGYFTCESASEDTPDAYTGIAHVCAFPDEKCDCFDDPTSSAVCASVLDSPTMDSVCNDGCGKDSLCFTPSTDQSDRCVVGKFTNCGSGTCVPSMNTQNVPTILCDSTATTADGVAAILDSVALNAPVYQTARCQIAYVPRPDGNRVCPLSIDVAPSSDAVGGCRWVIWGGHRYHLGFENPAGGLMSIANNDACATATQILIKDTLDPVPAHDKVRILHQFDGAQQYGTQIYTLDLIPTPVEDCGNVTVECAFGMPAP